MPARRKAQPGELWQLHFRVPRALVIPLEEALADVSIATSSFEDEVDPDAWTVELLTECQPDMQALQGQVVKLAAQCGVLPPEPQLMRVKQEDWQAKVARDFPPFSIGPFFVHGAHARAHTPPHAMSIQVEAGMAFGSGEHATTQGCLLALAALVRRRRFSRVLDMGCGSGILAMAVARCWPEAEVVAVDIDPMAVSVARQNMRFNRVAGQVRVAMADGFDAKIIKESRPFDLIVANILARPLIAMSRNLAAHLDFGGVAVLSGLLSSQAASVLAAYRRQGLRLAERRITQEWATLVMER